MAAAAASSGARPATKAQSTTSFGTVLVARNQQSDAPSELEIVLRQWSQKLRVVSSLSGGAHFLLPGIEGGTTVAMRVYDSRDIVRLEEDKGGEGEEQQGGRHKSQSSELSSSPPSSSLMKTVRYLSRLNGTNITTSVDSQEASASTSNNGQDDDDDDVDRLRAFRDSFKYPVVFFVVPPGQMQREQLGRSNSFVARAQRALARPSGPRKGPAVQQGSKDSAGGAPQTQPQPMARVFIVPDVTTIIRTMSSVIDSIKPDKIALKKKFFDQEAVKTGLPDPVTGLATSEAAVAAQCAGAFRAWAQRSGVTPGDADVLISILGTLSKVTSADSTVLDNVPIGEESKQMVMKFFNPDVTSDGQQGSMSGAQSMQDDTVNPIGGQIEPSSSGRYHHAAAPSFPAVAPPLFAAAAATAAHLQSNDVNFTPMTAHPVLPQGHPQQVHTQQYHQQPYVSHLRHPQPQQYLTREQGPVEAQPQQLAESLQQYRYGGHDQYTPQIQQSQYGSQLYQQNGFLSQQQQQQQQQHSQGVLPSYQRRSGLPSTQSAYGQRRFNHYY